MKRTPPDRAEFDKFLAIYNAIQDLNLMVKPECVWTEIPENFEDAMSIYKTVVPALVPVGVEPIDFTEYLYGYRSDEELEMKVTEVLVAQKKPLWFFLNDFYDDYRFFYEDVQQFRKVLDSVEWFEARKKIGMDTHQLGIGSIRCRFILKTNGSISLELMSSRLAWGLENFARLKLCLNCSKLFVQSRTDQKYCSENCRNSMQQKAWYAKNKETVLADKKKRYQEQKGLIRAQRATIRRLKKNRVVKSNRSPTPLR